MKSDPLSPTRRLGLRKASWSLNISRVQAKKCEVLKEESAAALGGSLPGGNEDVEDDLDRKVYLDVVDPPSDSLDAWEKTLYHTLPPGSDFKDCKCDRIWASTSLQHPSGWWWWW